MAVTVTAISPNNEDNCGLVEVVITGTNFQTDPAYNAQLIFGALTYNALNFKIESDTQITCDFEIVGIPIGVYDVRVNSLLGDGTLIGGFTVTPSNNYCTYTDIKRFCIIDRYNLNYNNKIKGVIPRASQIIDNETKRVWNQRQFIEAHDDETNTIEDNILFPNYYPIQQVNSLTIDGNVQVLGTDYWVYKTYLKGLQDFESDNQGIVLDYVGGPLQVPSFIRQLAVEITSIICNLKTVTYTTAEGIDKAVIITTFPEYIQQTYDKFKKVELW